MKAIIYQVELYHRFVEMCFVIIHARVLNLKIVHIHNCII